ncbi:hypothetical protein [Haloprofundus sp. MHR1]|nr:hypothetical protein [Haloprofundus sp. MHR1]
MSVNPGGPDAPTRWLVFVALAFVCDRVGKLVPQRRRDDRR